MKKLLLIIVLLFNSACGLESGSCEHIVLASTGGCAALSALAICLCCLRSCLVDKGKLPESQALIAERNTSEIDNLSYPPQRKAVVCCFCASIIVPLMLMMGYIFCDGNLNAPRASEI